LPASPAFASGEFQGLENRAPFFQALEAGPRGEEKSFQTLEKSAYVFPMFGKLITLILFAIVLAGCSTPVYEDGTRREYSDMPWNTPARWEGSVSIPGMGGYE